MPVRVSDPSPRELVVSPTAAHELESARASHDRFQQVYEGLIWILLRKPEAGSKNSITETVGAEKRTTTFWTISTMPEDHALPHVLLVYRFDEAQVELLRVRSGRLNTF